MFIRKKESLTKIKSTKECLFLPPCYSPVKAPDGTAEKVDEVVEFKAPTEGEKAAKTRADEKKNELPVLTALLVQAVCQTLVIQDFLGSGQSTTTVTFSNSNYSKPLT